MTREDMIARREILKDLIWSLLWQVPLKEPLYSKDIWRLWLGDREHCGCAFYPDHIKPDGVSRILKELVREGKVELVQKSKYHPKYKILSEPFVCNA